MNENHASLNQVAAEKLAYVTTIGRSSGKPHRIEIWFAAHDGRIFLLSGGRDRSDWVKNLMANPKVTIEIGDETFTGIASVPEPGSEADKTARTLMVQKYDVSDAENEWSQTSLAIVIDVDATGSS